jgi:AraC-like DNA-binding protein
LKELRFRWKAANPRRGASYHGFSGRAAALVPDDAGIVEIEAPVPDPRDIVKCVEHLMRLPLLGEMQITQVAVQLGYADHSHFVRAFRRSTGQNARRIPPQAGHHAQQHGGYEEVLIIELTAGAFGSS